MATAQVSTLPEREVPVENSLVRVVQVYRAQPHQKTRLHKHDMNRVMIYLNPGSQTTTHEAGKVEKVVWKAGEVLWSPAAGMHIAEITSDEPARIVEIELRNVPGNRAMAWPARDPVKADKAHYRVDFENDQVRVVRMRLGPGQATPTVDHGPGPRLVTYLTAQEVELRSSNGGKRRVARSAEKVEWIGSGKDGPESMRNMGATTAEAVIVYFKE